MLKRYEDKTRCPEGHAITIRRNASSAGKVLTTFCKECGYSHRMKANYPPSVEPPAPSKGPKRESQIEDRLVKRVKELGGEVRKVKWIGRSGAPDRLVMLPIELRDDVTTIWVELKAPGVKPAAHQLREHERMRKMGQRVEIVDSYERIEEILK